jgi:hypothetical protein
MIKFFRQLRYNLLESGKTRKYFKYAIGEIVLVVIGILIALSINNKNELRKNDIKVNSFLKQIHSELAYNIKRIDELTLDLKKKDSFIYLIMNNKIEHKNHRRNADFIISSSDVMVIKDEGFKTFMLNPSIISSHFAPLIIDLKELYITDKEFVEFSNDKVDDVVNDYLDWLSVNTTWYYNGYFGNELKQTDEEINFYFSNNSQYHNWVRHHYMYSVENLYPSIITFRFHAYEIYKKLTKILHLTDDDIESFSIEISEQEKQHITGTYQNGETTVEIVNRNNKFYINDDIELFLINKTFYIANTPNSFFRTFDLDEHKNVTGITVNIGNYLYKAEKIK